MNRNVTRRSLLASAAVAACLGLFPGSALADPSTDELQAQLEEARAQLEVMGNNLAALQDDLASQTEAVEITRSNIYDIEVDMDETSGQLDAAREVLSERMSVSYKSGSDSALDVILGSTSIEDLVSRVYYLDKLGEADAQTIATVNALVEKLQQQRDSLVEQQEEQEAQLEATQASLADYQSEVSSAQSYYSSLDEQVQQRLAEEAAAEAERQAAENPPSAGAQTTGMANAVTTVTGGGASSGESSNGGSTSSEQTGGTSQGSDPEPEPEPEPDNKPSGGGSSSGGSSNGGGSSSGGSSSGGSSSGGSSSGGSSSTPGVAHTSIVSAAATMLGKPYKQWQTGVNYGPNAEGYDCCGLVATAYHLCGYSYPAYQAPVSSIMATIKARGNWKSCNLSNYQSVLAPGDVIVCSTGHVAIYAGGDQMIHAPVPGGYVCYARVYACIGGGFGG